MPSCAPYALFCLHNVVQIDCEFASGISCLFEILRNIFSLEYFIGFRDYDYVDMDLKFEFNFINS